MYSKYLEMLAKHGVSGAHPGGLQLTKEILNTLPINSSTKLIDLGCGTGQTLVYLAKTYPCKTLGVDINDQMLFKAGQRIKRENLYIELVCADVMNLPFPPDSFDIALSESVTIFTGIDRALSEYARILKPGGTLLAIEMTSGPYLNERELKEIKSVYGILKVPNSDEWKGMLKQAGFRDIKVYDVKINSPLKFTSLQMMYDFSPHFSILRRYGRKLQYKVYQCKI
ncbi:MAG TPA: class I SAM-dependent methyltransferase [Clostridia bacterium]